jgi:hypothetical protein
MDPLAGLSLACNIMQVIEISSKALSVFRDIRGGRNPGADVSFNQSAPVKLFGELEGATPTKMPVQDPELQEAAREAMRISLELRKQLDAFKPRTESSRFSALAASVKYVLYGERKVQNLDAALGKIQKTMELHILADQRCNDF